MVAVVGDVQQKECLRDRIQKVEADELPRIRLERVESNPTAGQNRQPYCDFEPHGEVGFGRNAPVGKEIVEGAEAETESRSEASAGTRSSISVFKLITASSRSLPAQDRPSD